MRRTLGDRVSRTPNEAAPQMRSAGPLRLGIDREIGYNALY